MSAIIPIARDVNNLPFCIGTVTLPDSNVSTSTITIVSPVTNGSTSTTIVSPEPICHKVDTLSLLSPAEALSEHQKFSCMPYAVLARLLQCRINLPYPDCPVCPFYKSRRSPVDTAVSSGKNFGITYGLPNSTITSVNGLDHQLTTYVDASLGGEHTKGKSPTGVIVCHNGSPIMWSTHLQSLVALSTMESEMMATSTGTELTLFARNVFFRTRVLPSWCNYDLDG